MRITIHSLKTLSVIAYCIGIGACGVIKGSGTLATDEDQGAVASPVQAPQPVLDYWTAARMRAAEHISGANPSPVVEPVLPGGDENGYATIPRPYKVNSHARVTGALFYHDNAHGQDTHCSASVIATRSQSVIITAAHCILAATLPSGQAWASHLAFVPAYDGAGVKSLEEQAPYGVWPVMQAFVTQANAAYPIRVIDARYDLATARVYPRAGTTLQQAVGGAFEPLLTSDQTFAQAQLSGYPSGPYDGGSQRYCQTRLAIDIYSGGLVTPNCGVVSGNSGGPVTVGRQIVGVVHGQDQTRLLGNSYPSLVRAADADMASRRSAP